MDNIGEGNVIPIIGPRFLVGSDGQTSLQAQIASRLIQDCGKDVGEKTALPTFRELNEAASRLKGSVKFQELYYRVNSAIKAVTGASDFVLPAPLRQLAEISDFRLYVTLTPDDLLARCLRQRCAVNEIIYSPLLTPTEIKALPKDWKEHPGEVYLLYLFGKSCSSPTFAIHEEDFLEYCHSLIANLSQIHGMFLSQLQERNLLLIGCNFPEWLSRFFLRATNQKRLSDNYRNTWLVEPLKPEESFSCFLNRYSGDTEVLSDIQPVEFVAELHRRWMAEHGASGRVIDRTADDEVPRGTIFFLSYSRKTDQPRAEALYQELLRLGVTEGEIWFDRKTIEPGQDFQRRILDGIRSCRYFLPLLSSAANMRKEGFVFIEWEEATERLKGTNYDFLIPIILDTDYKPESYTVPSARKWADRHLDFAHAPGGQPDGRLEAKLKKLVSEIRPEDTAS